MGIKTYTKDPDAVLDYGFDWSDWLATAETISTSTWTVESGITAGSSAKTDTKTSQWLSGGTAGTTYEITNKIITSQSRTDERTLNIRVEQR